jgi:hypothetical protein
MFERRSWDAGTSDVPLLLTGKLQEVRHCVIRSASYGVRIIRGHGVGGECSVHVRDQNANKILVAEFDGNRFHGRPTFTVYIRTGVHRFYINLGVIQKF